MKKISLSLVLVFVICVLSLNVNAVTFSTKQWVTVTSSTPAEPVVNTTTIASGTYKVTLNFSGFYNSTCVVDNATYNSISIPGCVNQTDTGKPSLPIKTIMFEVPQSASPSVTLTSRSTQSLSGLYNVYPQQPSATDTIGATNPAFTKDSATYSSTNYFPASNLYKTKVVTMRNHKILMIDVSPILVIPASKSAQFAKSIDLSINCSSPAVDSSTNVSPSADYDSIIANKFPKLGSTAPMTMDSSTGSTNLPIYMILMDDQFNGNTVLNDFIQWKKEKGYDVRVVKTSQINSNGSPTNTEIINYMRNLSSADYPAYLLIIGNDDQASGVKADSSHSDLGIACRTSTDNRPDLLYGRIPAYNSSELSTMLTKVLNMDKNPPPAYANMYKKVVVASTTQDSDDLNNVEDRAFSETADAVASYYELCGANYGCTRAIVNPENMTVNGSWNKSGYSILWKNATGSTAQFGTRFFNTIVSEQDALSRITNAINAGSALVFHRDHGAVNGWGNPGYSTSNVNALTNGVNTPLVLSINCLTGSYFYDNSFVRSWFRNSNGGAYAFVGAVNSTFTYSNEWFAHGLFMGFESGYRSFLNNSTTPNWTDDLPASNTGNEGTSLKLGQMVNFGKMYVYQNCGESYGDHVSTLYHLFGDPESSVHVLGTTPLNVIPPPERILTGTQSLTISTVGSESGCLVTLYGDSSEPGYLNIHMSGVTDSTGSVTFNIAPYTNTTGKMHVTVTKPVRMPYSSTVTVDTLLSAPVNFRATNRSGLAVEFGWSYLNGATSYALYRKPSNSTQDFTKVAETTNNRVSVTTPFGTYDYCVAALDASGNRISYFSTTSTIEALYPAPENFTKSSQSGQTVTFTWTNVTGTRYAIYRRVANSVDPFTKVIETTSNSATLSTPSGGYEYYIAIVDSSGNQISYLSSPIIVTY